MVPAHGRADDDDARAAVTMERVPAAVVVATDDVAAEVIAVASAELAVGVSLRAAPVVFSAARLGGGE